MDGSAEEAVTVFCNTQAFPTSLLPRLAEHLSSKTNVRAVICSNELPLKGITRKCTAHVQMSWTKSTPVFVYYVDPSTAEKAPAKNLFQRQRELDLLERKKGQLQP